MGDIVLLKDDSLKLHSWPLAKVTEVSPGPDGVVRVVTLTLPGESLKLLTVPRGGGGGGGGGMSKTQGMDLEITTAAALRGHSRGHSSPKKITALPSNRMVNTSIELINTSIETHAALAFSFMHALNIMFTSPQAITQSLAIML